MIRTNVNVVESNSNLQMLRSCKHLQMLKEMTSTRRTKLDWKRRGSEKKIR